MSTYIGFDFSLCATGYVVLKDGQITRKGTILTTPKEANEDRLVHIADTAVQLINDFDPEQVAAEGQAHAKFGVAALAQVHGAFKYAMKKAEREMPVYVAPSTLKKFCTGSGRGEKSDVKMAVLEKWGEKLTDNNVCDAYVVARIAGAVHGGLPAKFDYERECLKVVIKGAK